jgi:chromosome segregation ATPase
MKLTTELYSRKTSEEDNEKLQEEIAQLRETIQKIQNASGSVDKEPKNYLKKLETTIANLENTNLESKKGLEKAL